MIGWTLSHYRILERLGEGGMGIVYLAEDTRLERKVALKLLDPELAADPVRLERFEREARTVAALNHPNIVTIHSVEEAPSPEDAGAPVRFLTMELVQGRGLDRIIAERGLPLDRFFELAIPIAEAVATAHDHGVTHRDLKPANIMVDAEGRVKVLDFGLAKLREETAQADAGDLRTEPLTQEGVVVGTVPYMSPEQVQGQPVDQRTDIFSLGIILYEMLSGRRPFGGESSAEVVSSILRDDPRPVHELQSELPRHLGRVVRRCLEKDRRRRYQSARDVHNELIDLRRDLDSGELTVGSAPVADAPRRRPPLLRLLAAIVATAAAAGLAYWLGRGGERADEAASSPPTPPRLIKLTSAPGLEDDPAWSPDGRFLAHTTNDRGHLDIVLLPLGGGDPIRAVSGPHDDAQPAWSPDGSRLAFVSAREHGGQLSSPLGFGPLTPYLLATGGDLYVAPAFGGPSVKVATDAYSPSWSPDGEWIVYQSPRRGASDIWRAPAAGGEPEVLTDDGHIHYQPAWSPDGHWIAYGTNEQQDFSLVVRAAAEGPATRLELDAGQWLLEPSWSPDGRYIYFSSNLSGRVNVWRSPFRADPEPRIGEPQQVTFGGGSDLAADVATSGRLAFTTTQIDLNVWEWDVAAAKARQVTFETGEENHPIPAPDGERLLIASDRSGELALWTFDLQGNALSNLGPTPAAGIGAAWSPDGRELVMADQAWGAFVRREVGSLRSVPLTIPNRAVGLSWSPTRNELAFAVLEEGDSPVPDIAIFSLDSGELRRFERPQILDIFPAWSPDGERLVYSAELGGTRNLQIIGREGGEPLELTSGEDEDSHPQWSPTDPDTILFLRNHKNLCLVSVSTGEVRRLTDYSAANIGLDYPSWSPDGTKIYYPLAERTGDIYVTEE